MACDHSLTGLAAEGVAFSNVFAARGHVVDGIEEELKPLFGLAFGRTDGDSPSARADAVLG